jgi:pimeloyl-ACP methyl ester carboxylesterase
MVYRQDLEKSLPKIRVPVYLLWSKNSSVLPLWMGERLHQRIPNSIFNPNFSDKNHLWCLLEQEKVAKEVKKILERH